jgi:gamma-glutamyltranspeptidase/glutathione hydrolase
MALVFGLLSLGACSSNPLAGLNPFAENGNEAERGTIGFVQGFFGGVAVDEPRAALVGRDILSSGGTAADVAVAVTLTLAVTKPSSASLGGGGVCVVHDAKTNTTETLDFLAGVPKSIPPGAVRPSAVPGTIRGLALLHAKYGKLDWKQLVSPAENLARFGNRVSRASAEDLRRLPPAVLQDPEFRRVFGQGRDGQLIGEGDFFKQLDLSAVLSRIRTRGAGDFYTGLLGRSFADAASKAGGGLSLSDLRNYTPKWRPTLQVPYIKNTVFHFPATAGPSGVLAAQMMGMMIKHDGWGDASPLGRSHLMAEISGRAFANSARWLRDDGGTSAQAALLVSDDMAGRLLAGFQPDKHTPREEGGQGSPVTGAGTSFVAVDREGSAVACGLTLNKFFGTGRIAPGTGILLSALPGPRGRGPDSLAAVLLINSVHNVFYFAAAASGGPVSPSALVQVTAGTLMAKNGGNLSQAIGDRRTHNGGDSGLTHYEQGLDGAVVDGLADRGHRLSPQAKLGLVNAIFCSTGVPEKKGASCLQQADPRGFGLSSSAQ